MLTKNGGRHGAFEPDHFWVHAKAKVQQKSFNNSNMDFVSCGFVAQPPGFSGSEPGPMLCIFAELIAQASVLTYSPLTIPWTLHCCFNSMQQRKKCSYKKHVCFWGSDDVNPKIKVVDFEMYFVVLLKSTNVFDFNFGCVVISHQF